MPVASIISFNGLTIAVSVSDRIATDLPGQMMNDMALQLHSIRPMASVVVLTNVTALLPLAERFPAAS